MIDCNCASFYFLRERMEKVFERKTKEDRPVLAICYDFDKTLSPDDMQAAHPTNPVEGCADANPKTVLPNDT